MPSVATQAAAVLEPGVSCQLSVVLQNACAGDREGVGFHGGEGCDPVTQ